MTETCEEVIEDVLSDMGLPWKRREGGWVVPASPHRPCEVLLSASPEGLRIEAVLCSWDTLGESEQEALSIVLAKASECLRPVRCLTESARAVVTATLPLDTIETSLRPTVAGVLVGSRTLAREATALLTPRIADAVLRFFADHGERKLAMERI